MKLRRYALLVLFIWLIQSVSQAQSARSFYGGQTGRINSIAFSNNGNLLASADDPYFNALQKTELPTSTLRIWDVASGVLQKLFSFPAHFVQVAFSADDKLLLVNSAFTLNGHTYDSILIWDIAAKKRINSLPWNSKTGKVFKGGRFSPDGKLLAVGNDLIRLMDTQSDKLTGKSFPSTSIDKGRTSSCVSFSPDNQLLAVLFPPSKKVSGSRIELWHVRTSKLLSTLSDPLYQMTGTFCFSPDSKYIVAPTQTGSFLLWDVNEGNLIGSFGEDYNELDRTPICVSSPDGKYLASGGIGKVVRLWDIADLQKLDSRLTPLLTINDNSLSFGNHTDAKGVLSGNETADLHFTLTNLGKGPAKLLRVNCKISGDVNGIHCEAPVIPILEAGKSESLVVRLQADEDLMEGRAKVRITIMEPHGLDALPFEFEFSTLPPQSPKLEITDAIFSSESGKIKSNYPATLQVLLQNTGMGKSKNTEIKVTMPDGVLNLGDSIITVGDNGQVNSGESKKILIPFVITQRFNGSEARIKIRVTEQSLKNLLEKTFAATLEEKLAVKNLSVYNQESPRQAIVKAYLTSDIDRDIPVNHTINNNRYALVIGNEDYQQFQTGLNSDQNVIFARNDATVFKDYLVKTLGFPAGQVFLLTDATRGQMSREIERITELAKLTKNSEIVFYYAGHGLPDKETHRGYIMPVDVTASNLKDGISLFDLYSKLASSQASRIMVFLDACFSGGGRGENGLLAARTVKIEPKGDILEGNVIAFTATSQEEYSLPLVKEAHGLFTYLMLKKLKETQGDITLQEMKNYLEEELPKKSLLENGMKQTPQVMVAPDLGNIWQTWKF